MHVHFVGIGGSGVSGLALMAQQMGYLVSGCDEKPSPYFKMVKEKGIKCFSEHSAKHLEGVDIVVRSSAVSVEKDEIKQALKKGIKVFSRGEFLAQLVKNRKVIGVAGSHGKTSTAWMIYHVLKEFGLNPSIYSGGKSSGVSNISAGSPCVVELDESDGSMFMIMPETLVINNLEFEHADFYSSPNEMLGAFERYLLPQKPKNLIIGRGYDLSDSLFAMFSPLSFPTVDEIRSCVFWQNSNGIDFYSKENEIFVISDYYEMYVGDVKEPAYILQNRSSSLLTSLAFLKMNNIEPPPVDFKNFWQKIPLVDRRFEVVGNYKGTDLVDDYAHHPSELTALLEYAEFKYKNFCLVFQPHRISRFTTFYDQFVKVLKNVEPLIILPVYSAGEKMDGASSADLYEKLKRSGTEIYYFDSVSEAGDFLQKNLEGLRVRAVVAAGAGDLNKVFEHLGVK